MRNGKGWFGRTKGGERIQIITAATAGPAHDNVGAKLRPVKGYGYGHPGHLHHKDHPHRHGFHHRHGQDFYTRIQNAIMSLGPWEGRAVAFVLGCGLGVLLRMIWVLTVVTYRSIRGSDETEYVQVTVFDEDEEDQRRNTPISAPPAYVYPVDEKVELEAPKAAAPTANEN
ncbi:hypothetical protein CC2G_004885 [Coprinopsis cinerea AmutBmut pab1-1]|nr:hypothetical protein CC2G_004885 [Coprinopsis cinerea AmutBmut pab1-1]